MKLITDRFLDSVNRYPEKEAVIHNDNRVTYKTLSERAFQVSDYLQKSGLNKGDRVSLLLTNTPDYVAFYYGVLLAGGVAVALNSAAKYRDIKNWLKHSESRFLFTETTHPEYSEIDPDYSGQKGYAVLAFADGELTQRGVWRWDEHASDGEPVDVDGVDLAAIIYTSGTTGAPKGVTLSHGNIAHNVNSILDYLELTGEDKILNVLPFYYSYGNSVLHTHMAAGGSLVLEDSLLFPHKTVQKMVDEKVTGFSGVPSTFALLLSRVKMGEYDLAALRYMTQAGGGMSPAHIQRVREELPAVEFVVMYGQTEATARISYLPADRLEEKLGSAGIAIPGVEIKICNEQGEVLPANQQGEIWVTGANIMQGYWRNPEMTRLVLDNGWLKTGDLAVKDEEGFIFIQGRSSDMIKSGAHRISPKEIEEVILELPEVAEVAVVGKPDEMLGQVIKAVIIPVSKDSVQKRDVMQHCKKNLAIYKLPKIVEFQDELPKTASGKIQRFKLIEEEN